MLSQTNLLKVRIHNWQKLIKLKTYDMASNSTTKRDFHGRKVNITFNRFENGNQFDHALVCCNAIKNYDVKTVIGSYKFINKLKNTIFISLTLRCGKNKTYGRLCASTSSRSEREIESSLQ